MAFGDLEGALPLAEKAVVLDGSNASYHYQLAAICGVLAEHASLFKKASWATRFKEEADKAAALDQKNVDARFALMEFYRQAPRLMGGDKRKAREMVERSPMQTLRAATWMRLFSHKNHRWNALDEVLAESERNSGRFQSVLRGRSDSAR
jgi:hypothetical protein